MLCSLFCIMVLHVGFCKSFIHDTNIVHSCLERKKLHKWKCWFCGGFLWKIILGVEPKHGLVLGVWSLHKVVKRKKSKGRPSHMGPSCYFFFSLCFPLFPFSPFSFYFLVCVQVTMVAIVLSLHHCQELWAPG